MPEIRSTGADHRSDLPARMRLGLQLAIIALAIPAPLLTQLGYSILQFEYILVVTSTIIIGLLLGVSLHRHTVWQNLLISTLAFWIADAYLTTPLIGLIVFGLVLALLGVNQIRDNIVASLVAFSAVWVLGCALYAGRPSLDPPLIRPTQQTKQGSQQLRPLVHLILDEQMSPRTLPEYIPIDHPANQILNDYVDRRFTVYSKVQSSSSLTLQSIGSLVQLGAGSASDGNAIAGGQQFQWQLQNNPYLQSLVDSGYQVTVVQSDFLDYCASLTNVSCHVYSRIQHGSALTRHPTALKQRSLLVLHALNTAFSVDEWYGAMPWLLIAWILDRTGIVAFPDVATYARPSLMLDVMKSLSERLTDMRHDEAFFIHLLVPHYPYVLSDECELLPLGAWSVPNRSSGANRPLTELYRSYWSQSVCIHRSVLAIVDQLMKGAGTLDPIVIVHGDHGSRLGSPDEKGKGPEMTETFLAIFDGKLPAVEDASAGELNARFSKFMNGILIGK